MSDPRFTHNRVAAVRATVAVVRDHVAARGPVFDVSHAAMGLLVGLGSCVGQVAEAEGDISKVRCEGELQEVVG